MYLLPVRYEASQTDAHCTNDGEEIRAAEVLDEKSRLAYERPRNMKTAERGVADASAQDGKGEVDC